MPDNNTIGQAYIQIKPSAEGISGDLEKALGDAGTKSSGSFGKSFASGIAKAGAATAAAVGVAATKVAALTQSAVSGFAEYEQLVGGVETLFGTGGKGLSEYAASVGLTAEEAAQEYSKLIASQEAVKKNAEQAFATAGMSANEYMETVTSFSASLLQSLGGDTEKAASVADMAIRDMSDNANKMGTSMESIQNAYQGFAKQNYTMLDNLKLGYGGTKSEMERLLADAQAISGVEYNLDSLSDVYEAINVIQTELGITGTTALEASDTISGSVASVGAAWQNLVAGFANPDADLGALINDVVTTASTALENLMPAIEQALVGIGEAITKIAPILVEQLPGLLESILPVLLEAATSLVNALVQALPELIAIIIEQLPAIFDTIIDTVLTMLPMIIDLGLDLILALADGLIEALPELIPAIVDVILAIVDKLTEPDTIVKLLEAAVQIIVALAEGLIEALPKLLDKVPEIIANLVTGIIKAAPKMLEGATELIMTLLQGILNLFPKILTMGSDIVNEIGDGLKEAIGSAKEWGKDLIDGFLNGIKAKWEDLKATVSSVAQVVKDFLGFSEPDYGPLSNFHTFAPDMMSLFAEGIKDNMGLIDSAMNDVTGQISQDLSVNPSVITPANHSVAVAPSGSDVYGLLSEYLPYLRERQSVEIGLVGEANGLFKAVRRENTQFMRRTGQSAFV